MIQAGDVVELEQTVATLETDKASMDLPSSAAGTIQQVYIKPGDTVSEGSLIATVLVSDAEVSIAEPAAQPAAIVAETSAPAAVVEKAPEQVNLPTQRAPEPKAPEVLQSSPELSGEKAHASPSVRLFARELGLSLIHI